MSSSITRSVQEIKANLRSIVEPEMILELCRSAGHAWRDRTLGPVQTVYLLLAQILHGNTSCAHVRQLGNCAFTRSAYCEARKRLPVSVLRGLMRETARRVSERTDHHGRWRGHRVVSVDGSTFSMADTNPLRKLYHWAPGNHGHEFPVSKFVAMFDLVSGVLLGLVPATMRDHELTIVHRLRELLLPDDVLVADRLYCTYGYLSHLQSQGVHAVMRVAAGSRNIDFRPHRHHAKHKHWRGPQSIWIRQLGRLDQIVEWIKPIEIPMWLSRSEWERIPERLRVRELRYRLSRRGYRPREVTIVTTLLDSERYPKAAVAELYGQRWRVETNFRHLKTTMGMDILRCQTVEGIHRELAAFGIVYNAVRLVMLHVASTERVPPDRVSFVDVLRWMALACPGTAFPAFEINAVRSRSPAPRNVRRRHKNHTYMTRPRQPQRKLRVTLELSPK